MWGSGWGWGGGWVGGGLGGGGVGGGGGGVTQIFEGGTRLVNVLLKKRMDIG